MKFDNEMILQVSAKSQNEAFARSTVAAFAVSLNPTLEQINDIKTAVSEAVTNAIVHGYEGADGMVTVRAGITGNILHISVADSGRGIEDIKKAMQPFYTTKPEQERSGMGFTVMESFMDSLEVEPNKDGKGITVIMQKTIS